LGAVEVAKVLGDEALDPWFEAATRILCFHEYRLEEVLKFETMLPAERFGDKRASRSSQEMHIIFNRPALGADLVRARQLACS
jgi:hypothetical protein